jgi:hypothetical protein
MKRLLMIAILACSAVGFLSMVGCETDGQKMADLHAEEELRDAKEQLKLGAMRANTGECFTHLEVNPLTANNSPKWNHFKKAHHIDRDAFDPAIDDEELKDCLAIK